jgi:hypothetical protein
LMTEAPLRRLAPVGLGPCHSALVNRSGGGSARRAKSRPQGSESAGFEGQESLGSGVATCPPGIRSNEAAALLDTQPIRGRSIRYTQLLAAADRSLYKIPPQGQRGNCELTTSRQLSETERTFSGISRAFSLECLQKARQARNPRQSCCLAQLIAVTEFRGFFQARSPTKSKRTR